MANRIKKTTLLTLLFLLFFANSKAQTEFLVTVNPEVGSYTIIDSLPGVNWIVTGPSYTVFDEINQRFIFKGSDSLMNYFLYTVDAITGEIIYSPTFPTLSDPSDNIIELQYDNSADKLYGLHWDSSENREYFVSVDPGTGFFTIIDSIPGVNYIAIGPNFTTFDKNHHRYIFKGIDFSGVTHLYTIDATTGLTISSPVFPAMPDDIIELHYDNSTDILYGLHRDYTIGSLFLTTFDPVTTVYTHIDSIPGISGIATSPHFSTFDEINHRYTFYAYGPDMAAHLYTLDALTAGIVYSPLFPQVPLPENIIELKYDNSSGTLYALHWGPTKQTGLANDEKSNQYFKLFPNPFSSSTNISFDKTYGEIDIFIYNEAGQVVRKESFNKNSTITIQKGNLPNGVYFVSVFCDHQGLGVERIVIE